MKLSTMCLRPLRIVGGLCALVIGVVLCGSVSAQEDDVLSSRPIEDYSAVKVSKDFRRLLLNALKQKGWYLFKNPSLCNLWQ